MQKGLYLPLGLLLLMILFLGVISAEGCEIKLRTNCSSNNTVLGLSGLTNAHGELWNQSSYDYILCCDFGGNHDCDGTNKILGLSSPTNAHAEIPSLDNYPADVCYGNLECRNVTGNCNPYEIKMLSLSSETNAHIGGFDDYNVKVCCKDTTNVIVYDYSIKLQKGWNLISIPLVPEDDNTTIENVLGDVDPEVVWSYQEGEWHFYSEVVGDLKMIIPGFGYYIKMTEDGTLYLRGKKMYGGIGGWGMPPSVILIPGWNLIGHYGLKQVSISDALTSLNGYYDALLNIGGHSQSKLDSGQGYWLFVKGTNNLQYAPSNTSYI